MPIKDRLHEALVRELKSLRQGEGISAAKVLACQELMRVFVPLSPAQVIDELLEHIQAMDMPDGKIRCLLVAYNPLREHSPDLTKRRMAHAETIPLHWKRAEGWENDVIEELAAQLRPPEEWVLYVNVQAEVHNRMATTWHEMRTRHRVGDSDDEILSTKPFFHEGFNKIGHDPSAPVLLYIPHIHGIHRLVLSVLFEGEEPTNIWGVGCDNLAAFMFGANRWYPARFPADDGAGTIIGGAIDKPNGDWMYALCWSWD